MSDAITLAGLVLADGSLHVPGSVPLPQGEVEVTVRLISVHNGAAEHHNALRRARTNYRVKKAFAAARAKEDTEVNRLYAEYGGGD